MAKVLTKTQKEMREYAINIGFLIVDEEKYKIQRIEFYIKNGFRVLVKGEKSPRVIQLCENPNSYLDAYTEREILSLYHWLISDDKKKVEHAKK